MCSLRDWPCGSTFADAEPVWLAVTKMSEAATGAARTTPIRAMTPMVVFMFVSNPIVVTDDADFVL